jgi:hypothetical protein
MNDAQQKAMRTAQLFQAVGAVVVAGGHVEWRLKRLLLWLHGKGPSDLHEVTSLNWTILVERTRLAAASAENAEVLALLHQAEDQNLKWIRDNAVHTHWWADGRPGVVGSRHPSKKGAGSFILVGTIEDLHASADKLFQFAARLAELAPDDGWPTMVPDND